MKYAVLFCSMLIGWLAPLQAQIQTRSPQNNSFDPAFDPIAVRTDTSTQLVVSEFMLAKSLSMRLGKPCTFNEIRKVRMSNGMVMLIFDGQYASPSRQKFSLGVPLIPDNIGKFFYASYQALQCETEGCNSCSIADGKCVGCCFPVGNNGMQVHKTIDMPFQKVQINFD
ncbi:MAG: hypothetical protein JNJ57_00355 [Saprospiraceae bacterium]|nr:hypothetical protein [Saprospiraceae bacterium]